jgi:hypothetical protein
MDPLDKSQKIQPIAFEDIPTPEEHAKDVRRIFWTFGCFAASMFVLAVLIVGVALWRGVPLQTIAFVVPIVMGAGIVVFAIGYAMPVGLVSLKRLEIAYRMGYFSVGQNVKAVAAMETIATRVRRETDPLPTRRRPVEESPT